MTTLPAQGHLPSLDGAVEWLNSKPLTPTQLRGKVVLVDFWTYTCVNWTRTLPYVRAWAQKYRASGLVVVGVHTPEFGFERDLGNVRWAIEEMGVDYPVAVDSNYAIWNAFRNQYWPAEYLVDAKGRIRYHHFGEGAYDEAERAIQALLTEAGHRDVGSSFVQVHPRGLEVAADWDDVRSPENFLGSERANGFVSGSATLKLNEWELSGNWTVGKEAVVLKKAGGRIAYRFQARDLNLIMAAPTPSSSIRFRVLLDGRPPGSSHGDDVDAGGYGTVSRPRTYQLIRQPKPILERRFEIEFLEPGAEAFDFTFG